jgi:hypothetical protein
MASKSPPTLKRQQTLADKINSLAFDDYNEFDHDDSDNDDDVIAVKKPFPSIEASLPARAVSPRIIEEQIPVESTREQSNQQHPLTTSFSSLSLASSTSSSSSGFLSVNNPPKKDSDTVSIKSNKSVGLGISISIAVE